MDAFAAFGLANRIESEEHADGFRPIGAVGCSVQQAHVKFDMRPVIFGQLWRGRCSIFKRFDHDAGTIGKRSLHRNQEWSESEATLQVVKVAAE